MIPFDLPPKPAIWVPPKPAIIRASSMKDIAPLLAMPLMTTFAIASVRGVRSGSQNVRLSFRSFVSDAANQSTYTFNGVDFGNPASNRHIIALAAGGGATDGPTLTTCTIGGVAATSALSSASTDGSSRATIFIAAVPTGATGTVTFTFSTSRNRAGAAIWAAYGLASTTAADTATSTSTAASLDMDTQANDIVIVGGIHPGGTSASPTGYTERFDSVTEALFSGGDAVAAGTEAPRTITLTWADAAAGNTMALGAVFR